MTPQTIDRETVELAPVASMLDIARNLIEQKQVPAESIPALLTQMFDFQMKVRAVDAEEQFNRDFAACKREMPVVQKNGKVDLGNGKGYSFAEYDNIQEVIIPIEERHGFARSFESVPTKDVIHMRLVMRHRNGHVDRSSAVELPPDTGAGRGAMQARRSSSAYAKRGLTLDYWDIVTKGADNDAKTAEPISQEQRDALTDLLTESGSSANNSKFLAWLKKHYGISAIAHIQRHQFDAIHQALDDQRRAKR